MNRNKNSLFDTSSPANKQTDTSVISNAWKVLIVDDEKSVHDVTRLALNDFSYEGIGLHFFHAYSAAEAKDILLNEEDIALAIIDVVMEEEHAGLNLINYIRNDLKNRILRIVLRTGQPGQAPEREVLSQYDINDYKEKTELTSQKLYSTIFTSIRSYRDISALEATRHGLERVISSTAIIHRLNNLNEFINGVLEQLVAVLYLGKDTAYLVQGITAIEGTGMGSTILGGTGRYANLVGSAATEVLSTTELSLINKSRESKSCVSEGSNYAIYFSPGDDTDDVLLFNSKSELQGDAMYLLKLFCVNIGVAYSNILLNQGIEETQQELLYMLGEAIETRSRETGSHVRRVAEYCKILAEAYGLTLRQQELIRHASPLHDFGKIGIPDRILHKDGKLESEEWEYMKSHAMLGEEMLSHSDRELIKVASLIAGQHHEHWNGEGYPRGLNGHDISVYGRITAVADVYDALSSKRCYKHAWQNDEVIQYFLDQKGKQFEPKLVDILLELQGQFVEIQEKYPDPENT